MMQKYASLEVFLHYYATIMSTGITIIAHRLCHREIFARSALSEAALARVFDSISHPARISGTFVASTCNVDMR